MSEWIAYGKMECGVTVPVRVDYGPSFLAGCGVVGFHAEVKAQEEVSEVEAQA